MFLRKKDDLVQVAEYKDLKSQIDTLIQDKRKLKEELEELKLKKRLEAEEIAHLQRINEERLKQQLESDKLAMEREYQKKVSELGEQTMKKINDSLIDFHAKIEKRFGDELVNLKEVYSLLMQRLPNVNLEITKHIGDPTNIIEHKKR